MPDKGFHLCETLTDVVTATGQNSILAIQLTFCPDIVGPANVVGTALGQPGQNNAVPTTNQITRRVKKVEVHGDGQVANIKLVLKDGTAIELGVTGGTASPVFSSTLCGNFVGFNCNFHKKPTGQMQVDDTAACEVFEDFPITGYSVIPGFVDLIYYLYGTSVVMPWDSTDLGCDYVETYTTSYTKNGVASPKPLGLTEDLTITAPKLTLYTTNVADLGVWTVTITGATTMPASDSFTRTFEIRHDCLITTITATTTPVTTHAIETSADTTSLAHADATSTARTNPTYCGTKLYVISPLQSFYHVSGSDLVVDGGTLADVNSYSITLTVSLPDWPQITPLVKTIVVQIICQVQTLAYATAPASTSLIVNLEAQPVDIPVVVTKFPNCNEVLTYTLTPSTHSFLSIVNQTVSGASVRISGATIADANVYSMTLKATAASTIFISSASFDVTIICATTAFSISNPIANLSHFTASTLLSTSSFSVDQTPACNYAVTYTFQYELLSQTIATPWWSTFVEASKNFDFAASLTEPDIGAYTITTTATIPYINPATGSNWTTNFSFIFTIVSECTTTVLTDKTISDIVYGVTLTKDDTNIFFLDSIGTSYTDDTRCGPRKYTLTPSTYGWLSITGDTMSIETSDVDDVGVYPNIQLKIELQNYLMVTAITKTFQVTITCTVTTLAFLTPPTANTLVEVGVTSQPVDLNWAISKTPNCPHDPTFAISPDDLPWLTNNVNAVDGESGYLRTTGATLAHQGSYTRALTATIDALSTPVTFAIEIKDPCKTSAFVDGSTPADLTITMPSDGPTTQTQDIQTNIQQSSPAVVCPFTGSLTPNLSWISWSSPSITVDHSLITLPSDIGPYTFFFEVDSLNWPAEVENKIYTFSVTIVCTVTVLTLDSQAANIDPYVLNQGALTTTNSLDISQTSACNFAYTYTHACRKDTGAGYTAITCPSWLVWDVNTRKFTMTVTAVADIGLYEVTTTTEIPQVDPVTSANRVIDSVFTINVVSDCTITTISDDIINDMSFIIGKTAELQTIPFFEDTIATGKTDSNYCGARTIVLTPPEFTFAQISGSNIQIDTADPNFAGIYSVTFSVSLTNFPMVPALVKTFQVVIGCGEFTTAPASTQLHVGITTQPHDIAVPIFHTSACGPFLAFTLSASTPSFVAYHDLTATDAIVRISGALPSDHGDYLSLTLTATTNGVSVQQTFDVTINDPCSYAVFLTSPVAVPDMTLAYPGTQTIDQLVKAMTDIESNHGIVCGTSYALTSAPLWLGLTIDNLHVDASTILPADFMQHTITIEATSVLWDGPVARQSYTFLLTITCEITSVIPAYSPVTGEHNLDWANNYSPSTFVIPSFTVTPANCYALPPDVIVFDESQTKPGYITMSGQSFTIDTTDYTLQGNKDYLVHATVPTSQFLTGKVGYVSVKLWFYMLSCKTAVMEPGTINFNVYYVIRSKPVENKFATFIDSVGQSYGTPDLCGPRTISVYPQTDKIKTLPGADPFVDDWTISVYEDDMNKVGETTVTLTASFDNYPQATTASLSIKVNLFDPCWTTRLEPFKLKNMSTTIGEDVVSQLFSQIKDSQAETYAVPNLCGMRSMKFLQKQGFLSIRPPNNLWSDESFFSIDLKCEFDQPAGGWTITLEVGLEKYPDVPKVYAVFEVQIFLAQSPPYFILPPPSVISVLKSTIPTRWSYDLPAIMDVNWQDRVTLTAHFGLASTFLKLEGNTLVIKDLSSEEIPLGFTLIVLTLSDEKSEVIYKLGIRILDKLEMPVEIVEVEEIEENCQVRIVTPEIAPYFVYKSGSSPIMIRFDKFELEGTEECTKGLTVQLSLKTQWNDSRFSSESDWLQYADNSISNKSSNYFTISSDNIEGPEFQATVEITGKTEREEISSASISFSVTIKPDSENKRVNVYVPPPQMRLIKMNEDGIATLHFDSPLMVFDKPTDAFIENPARFLKFEIEKNPYTRYAESPEYLDYGEVLRVRVKSFSQYRIELDLTFYNPLYISLDQFNRDALRVTIIDPTTFISAINFWTNPEAGSTSTIEIFRQMPKSDTEKVNSIEKGGQSLTAALSASMPANIFLGLSLKYLWGMVNTLQFVIFMDKWQVNWPPNASKALAMIRKFALAEFIDTKEMQQQLFEYYGLNQTQPEELNAEDEPVQSRQLEAVKAANVGVRYGRIVGQVFLTLGIIAVIVIAVKFLNTKAYFRPYLQHFKEYLKRSIFWNLFIRLYLQGYLKVTFGFGLLFYRLGAKPDKPSVQELIFQGLYLAVFLVAIPILFLWVLVKNRNKLLLKKNKDQFGSLYLGVRIKRMITILNVFEFLAFRFMFVVLTFLLVPYPGILCNSYMLLNNFNIIYIGWFHPYETRTMQFVELLNMQCLHFVCYCLILLCNLLPSPEYEMNCGWFVIGLVCLIFFFNFCHLMYNTTKSIFYEWRLWTTKRRIIRVQKLRAAMRKFVEEKRQNMEEKSPSLVKKQKTFKSSPKKRKEEAEKAWQTSQQLPDQPENSLHYSDLDENNFIKIKIKDELKEEILLQPNQPPSLIAKTKSGTIFAKHHKRTSTQLDKRPLTIDQFSFLHSRQSSINALPAPNQIPEISEHSQKLKIPEPQLNDRFTHLPSNNQNCKPDESDEAFVLSYDSEDYEQNKNFYTSFNPSQGNLQYTNNNHAYQTMSQLGQTNQVPDPRVMEILYPDNEVHSMYAASANSRRHQSYHQDLPEILYGGRPQIEDEEAKGERFLQNRVVRVPEIISFSQHLANKEREREKEESKRNHRKGVSMNVERLC